MKSTNDVHGDLTALVVGAPREAGTAFAFFMGDYEISERSRRFVDKAWRHCAHLLDGDFAGRFAGEFHERVWELRLCSTLLDLGWPVGSGTGTGGPDFLVDACDGGPRTWIEATTVHHGDGPDAVAEPPTENGAISHDDPRAVILRYANALGSKRCQFEKARSRGDVNNEDACVIAINAAPIARATWDIPGEPPLIAQALYAIGEPFVRVSVDPPGVIGHGRHARPSVRKRNGSEVETRLFLDPQSSRISAVLFSRDELWNCPEFHGSVPGNEFILVHNQHAAVPLPQGWLGRGRELIPMGGELHRVDYRRGTCQQV